MLELLGGALLHIFADVVVATLFEWGFQSLRNTFRPVREANRFFAVTGLLLLGGVTGSLSVAAFGARVTPVVGLPGISLFIAPGVTGLALKLIGSVLESNGIQHSPLTTWWGGATFAFAAAGSRFVLVG